MITMQRLGIYITAEPFRPFRICMASGETFEVQHPEMISVGRVSARVDSFWSDEPNASKQRIQEISLLLIESIEPVEASIA